MITHDRDRVQIDSVRYGNHYKKSDVSTRAILDYIASLQRQIDRLNTRLSKIESVLTEDDSK